MTPSVPSAASATTDVAGVQSILRSAWSRRFSCAELLTVLTISESGILMDDGAYAAAEGRSQTRWLNQEGSSWRIFSKWKRNLPDYTEAFGDFSHRPEKAREPRQTLRQEAVHGRAEIATTEKTRTQIRFGPLTSIDTLQPLFI
jgi:hypothetical protein